MRILVVTAIFPPDIGGPATSVPQIAAALAERGHRVIVFTLSDHADHDDAEYAFRLQRLRRRQPRPVRWARTVRALVSAGRDADVLFVHGMALEAVLANAILRKPMVQKVVGDLVWEQGTNRGWIRDDFERFQTARYGVKIEILRRLRAWWTRRAHRVVVPSRYLAAWVERWGVPSQRIVTIYNAVGSLNDIRRAPLPLTTPFTIATAGRLVPWKGVDRLLEALVPLPEAGLVVIGDGPERPALEAQARALGLGDRVYFAGQRSRLDALALMAACDLFVLNSAYEGLPHVLLEAMALGRPVVATPVGGVPEIVRQGETGWLVPMGDTGALGSAIRHLAAAPEERRRLASGASQMVDRFSLERMVVAAEAVLMAAAGRSPDGF